LRSNDTATGFGGGDSFIYNPGYEFLEIDETANNPTEINLLQLGSGIAPEQVSITADTSGNANLTDGISGDVIKLDGQLSNNLSGVQQVQFADGTVWTAQQLINFANRGHHDGNSVGRFFGCESARCGKGHDDINIESNQFSRELRQLFKLSLRPVFNHNVFAFDVAKVAQSFLESREKILFEPRS
jgi:hypothetical protein